MRTQQAYKEATGGECKQVALPASQPVSLQLSQPCSQPVPPGGAHLERRRRPWVGAGGGRGRRGGGGQAQRGACAPFGGALGGARRG